MAYTSDKKPGALTEVTSLGDNDNLVVDQAGSVKRVTLGDLEAKIFDAKTGEASPTGTEVVVVRKTDDSLAQVALSDIVPALNITNAKVSASAEIVDTKLATIATAGKVLNSATTATSANTINAIVARDGSGNFSATGVTATTFTGTLAGSITGSAPTLTTGRTIALTGDVAYTSPLFNGSANVTATATIANNAVTTAKIADANVNNAKLASDIDAGKLTTGTLPIARIADGAVANAKIASGVDAGKLTTGTLPIARIADGAVTNIKLASDIDAAKLTTGTLPIARIADGAVTNAKLASNAVETAKIANDAVTNDKLSLSANAGEVKKALNADNSPPIYACRAWVNFDGTVAANLAATYTRTLTDVTITAANHGLIAGNVVRLDFTSGGAVDGTYTVTQRDDDNTFHITTAASGTITSGSVTLLRRLIRAAGNVSSVTYLNTAGEYVVNLGIALPDANAAIACSVLSAGDNPVRIGAKVGSAEQMLVVTQDNAAGAANYPNVHVTIFR